MTYFFYWHSDQGVRNISCPNIIHKILTLETNMHILYTKASFLNIYQFKCEKIFVQFFGTAEVSMVLDTFCLYIVETGVSTVIISVTKCLSQVPPLK